MMKHNSSELVFILDRSGSMSGLEADAIGGFNSMIGKQKEVPGEATVTTVLFDNEYIVLHDRVDIREVPEMTADDYVPRGSTALLDAVGRTVQNIIDSRKRMKDDEIPENTIVVITTDGMENSSTEYTYKSVKEIVDAKTKEGWQFIFLAANIDAFAEGSRFGIERDCAVNFTADAVGIKACFNDINNILYYTRTDEGNLKIEDLPEKD